MKFCEFGIPVRDEFINFCPDESPSIPHRHLWYLWQIWLFIFVPIWALVKTPYASSVRTHVLVCAPQYSYLSKGVLTLAYLLPTQFCVTKGKAKGQNVNPKKCEKVSAPSRTRACRPNTTPLKGTSRKRNP